MCRLVAGLCLFYWTFVGGTALQAKDTAAVARGYENLRTHEYLPPDFDDAVFADL